MMHADQPDSTPTRLTGRPPSSEDRYRWIFENALDGIFQTTPDGRFVAANPTMARINGYDSPGCPTGTATR